MTARANCRLARRKGALGRRARVRTARAARKKRASVLGGRARLESSLAKGLGAYRAEASSARRKKAGRYA